MKNSEYEIQVYNLDKVINIAIEVIKNNPPKGFTDSNINQFLDTYLDIKNAISNPDPKHKNSTSLKYYTNDVFTFFQEGHGDAVSIFWDKIKEINLPFKRENKILKILKRRKINSQIEYDFVTDVMNPYKTEGLISNDDLSLINDLLRDYEKKQRDLL